MATPTSADRLSQPGCPRLRRFSSHNRWTPADAQQYFGTGFLTRIDTTKSGSASLIYSTYLGGDGANNANLLDFGDAVTGVAVDTSNNAYLTGVTASTGTSFPTDECVSGRSESGQHRAAARSSRASTQRNSTQRLWCIRRIWKAPRSMQVWRIALGPNNVAYVTGTTESSDFPTTTRSIPDNAA